MSKVERVVNRRGEYLKLIPDKKTQEKNLNKLSTSVEDDTIAFIKSLAPLMANLRR